MDVLEGLNAPQREAVTAIEGPLLILAGPGSGKTRVIVHRVAYLIRVCGISPHRIIAVTFTNKAAREMAERLIRLLGRPAGDLTLGTFHAICARFLRRDGAAIGVDPGFVIYDDEDQQGMMKRTLQELSLDPKRYPAKALLSAISAAKSHLLGPEEYGQGVGSYFEEVVKRVYERYEAMLAQSRALDFDDLLMKAVLLFRHNPQVVARYQERYLHILIDEFQDTNLAQYELAKQLAGKYRNLCVVGDPDQSIYSWRYADVRNILNFERDYPEAKVVFLEQNYRSTQTILGAAEHVIAANQQRKPVKLWTENEAGLPLVVAEAYNEEEEAQLVAQEIEKLQTGGRFKAGDCAVMYRTNAQSRALEETFIRYGLPYRLVGATRFYQRREVKDIIAYLRLLHNSHDNVSLLRVINVPGRGIGQRTQDDLVRWAQSLGIPLYAALQMAAQPAEESATPPFASRAAQALTAFLALLNELMARAKELGVAELTNLLLERTGYRAYLMEGENGEERWENVLELRSVAVQFRDLEPDEGLEVFLEQVALVSDVDNLDEKADAVTLITLHQAKGLEFPVVFIVGMEEGVLPHIRSFDDPGQMEEERRLCYVGITRAKEKVYLLRAFRRSFMGASAPNPASRFLQDIPQELIAPVSRPGAVPQGALSQLKVQWAGPPQGRASVAPQPPPRPPLKAGEHVRHAKFGDGVVVSCQPVRDDQEVVVAFKGGAGVKRLLLSFAPLEKIP
ncbi:MAG: UvrD-helicase domain-containing protein [Chloroflexota bacterium]|nr:UvrD-helicase domain-containing protein [Chloroflexota bacterium]